MPKYPYACLLSFSPNLEMSSWGNNHRISYSLGKFWKYDSAYISKLPFDESQNLKVYPKGKEIFIPHSGSSYIQVKLYEFRRFHRQIF